MHVADLRLPRGGEATRVGEPLRGARAHGLGDDVCDLLQLRSGVHELEGFFHLLRGHVAAGDAGQVVVDALLELARWTGSSKNTQPWHFIVVRDRGQIARLAALYHEAWWAKRRDAGIHGPEDIPADDHSMRSAMRLADEIGGAPVIVLACATAPGAAA